MNFKQYLIEGRDAPLYHGTPNVYAVDIIDTDTLQDQSVHRIDGKNLSGVSLSRSINFAKIYAGKKSVVFELDQTLLSQKYKIKPVNYFSHIFKNARNKEDLKLNDSKYMGKNEYEEFVVGSITPLSKYVKRIIFDSELNPSVSKLNNSLGMHPKLYDIHTKRFVNEF